MSEKSAHRDLRGYVNPFAPGRTDAGQRKSMSGEVYTENKRGNVIDALIRSVRKGNIIAVQELYCLAPADFRPQKRRRLLTERIDAINAQGGSILELATGYSSRNGHLAKMLLTAYEQIATSGRARRKPGQGAPLTWPRSGPIYEGMRLLWQSRCYTNDNQRLTAIRKEFGKAPSRVWLAQQFGSPHGKQASGEA